MNLYYQDVPKERVDNLHYRVFVLDAAKDPIVRSQIIAACARDILFYVNTFCWTYDPRKIDEGQSPFLPFITYPYQDDAFPQIVECVRTGVDLVIEKSRDMGASWVCLTAMEWCWRWLPGTSFLMISRKEKLVDAPGDPDSLFWKIDYLHRYMPDWLLPRSHHRRKLHFGNDDAGSTIDGETTTGAAGVGGRRSAVFIDEFSRIEEGYQLLAGTADTTRCRIFNFTPWGTSNAAYKLARRGDVRKLRMHWSQHPDKGRGLYQFKEKKLRRLDGYPFQADYPFITDGKLRSPWYDDECRRRANEREVAQMLDIDYLGSAYQFFPGTMIDELQKSYCRQPDWEGDFRLDEDLGRLEELIQLEGGPLKLWFQPDGQGKPPNVVVSCGADVSAGSGRTNSVASFMNCQVGEKMAEYATPYLTPEKFAVRVVALCRFFRGPHGDGARLVWEAQGPGGSFGRKVQELGFGNYYRRVPASTPLGTSKPSTMPGWVPTPDAKRTMLSDYRSALNDREYLEFNFESLEECRYYEETNTGTVEHKGGDVAYDPETGKKDPTGAGVNHGDRVIAAGLSWLIGKVMFSRAKQKGQQTIPEGSLAWRRRIAHNQQEAEGLWA